MNLQKIYTTEIKPKGPYNFNLTASCYALPQDYDGTRAYIPHIHNDRKSVSIAYEKKGRIHVEVWSETRDDEIIEKIIKTTTHVLGLDEDLGSYYEIVKDDPLLAIVEKQLYGMHMRATSSLWEGILIGICQQNASFRQGWRMVMNLRKMFGDVIHIDEYNVNTYSFPTPSKIVKSYDNLLSAKVGYRRDIIFNVAKAFMREEPDNLEDISGIGQYTARVARIISLRKYDEFPVDRWFRRLIPYAYFSKDEIWSQRAVEDFAEKQWGEWQGLSAIMITIVTAAKTISEVLRDITSNKLCVFPDRPSPMTMWKYPP